jgi:hypothetical protein
LLWVIFALGLFTVAPFAFNPAPHLGDYSLWGYVRQFVAGGYRKPALWKVTVGYSLILAVPALVIGWLAQAAAVRYGLRLSGRGDPALAADYDDKPPPAG